MELKLDHASYTYQGKFQKTLAVKEAEFAFQSGTLYSIVGVSGSGKSTLLSMLAGLKLPTDGEVLFDGVAGDKLDRSKLRRDQVTVIYQSFNLFPNLTVEENVCYPLMLQKIPKKEAKTLARERLLSVGLQEKQFKRQPNMLSGGEQQRVAIARALAAGSQVILADEPTGNLDSENGKNIITILKDLAHKEGRCVIVVTHDRAIAEEADQVLTMKDGVLVIE